jgi:hypothetical protein
MDREYGQGRIDLGLMIGIVPQAKYISHTTIDSLLTSVTSMFMVTTSVLSKSTYLLKMEILAHL